MMPVMDARGFRIEQLRNPATASIPTVLVSAARDGRQEAAALGVAGYLQKPIELELLLELVSRSVQPEMPGVI
jgi:CheY-like chemotaxis protein